MKPEKLTDLIVAGDIQALATALAKLNAVERKKLSKTASDLALGLDDLGWNHRQNSPRAAKAKVVVEATASPRHLNARVRSANRAGKVAMLGCCPVSAIKKTGISLNFTHLEKGDCQFPESVFQVFQNRDRTWNEQLIEAYLTPDSDGTRWIEWSLVNRMVKAGICQKPEGRDYIELLTQSVAIRFYHGDAKARESSIQELIEAPGFLETDVYRIFEYDTDGFAYTGEEWEQILKKLTADGLIDRARVIQAALRAATNRFRQNTLAGILKFLDALAVQPEEWKENLDDLFALLRSPVSSVINYALKRIKELNRGGWLEPTQLINALPAVFQSPAKGSAKSALTLIQQTARKHPTTVPLAISGVMLALDHAEADVNEKALELLDKWSDRAHSDHAIAIRTRVESLPASLTERALQVASAIDGTVLEEAPLTSVSADTGQDRLHWIEAAREIQEPWRSLAGLDEILETWDQPEFPPSARFPIVAVPVLSALETIEPIENHTELIDAIAHALETVDDAIEVERILDGISRLGIIPDELDAAARPVGVRLNAQSGTETSQGFRTAMDSANSITLLRLVLKAAEPDRKDDDWAWGRDPSRFDYAENKWYALRLDEMMKHLNAGHLGCLLSAPTHQRGWIDPEIFASRILKRMEAATPIGEIDFLLALLRLAPERREAALDRLADHDGPWIRLAQMALNGPTERLGDLSDLDAAMLDVAAHVRTKPIDPSFIERWGLSPKTTLGQSPVPLKPEEVDRFERMLEIEVFNSHTFLTQLYHYQESQQDSFSIWRTRMNAWTSKQTIDHYLAIAAAKLRGNLNENSRVSEPDHVYLEVLFEPDRTWNELAHYLASLGCLSKNKDLRIVTLDALIEACEDGRADPQRMGGALALAHTRKLGNAKRLADALTELGRVSALHQWFSVQSVELLISSFENVPRDASHVLELYLNGLIELGLAPSASVKKILIGIKGSSKTAKLATRILELALLIGQSTARTEAKALAFQSRLNRASRWQTCSISHRRR